MRRYQRTPRLPRDITPEEISLETGVPVQGNEASYSLLHQMLELLSDYIERKKLLMSNPQTNQLWRMIRLRLFERIRRQADIFRSIDDEPGTEQLLHYMVRQFRNYVPGDMRYLDANFHVPYFDDERQDRELAQ